MWPIQLLAFELDGQTEFSRILMLNSSISAKIESVHITQGQKVAKGDLLLTLNPLRFQAITEIALAEVNSLIPKLAKVRTEMERAEELFSRDSLSMVELQVAEQNHAIAEAQLSAAQARLKMAQYDLSETRLYSPIDAIVYAIDAQEQEYINNQVSDKGLVTLVNNNEMIVQVLLPAEFWNRSLINNRAEVRFLNKTYQGKVIEIGQRQASTSNNHPALEMKVMFDANGEIPANTLVKVNIKNN
jgi:HlyD family secretion protein